MNETPRSLKLQFSLRTALAAVAVTALVLGGFAAAHDLGELRILGHYLVLTALLPAASRALHVADRKRAFWLGFSIVVAIHLMCGEAYSFADEAWIRDCLSTRVFSRTPILPSGIALSFEKIACIVWPPLVLILSTLGGVFTAWVRLRPELVR